MDDDYVDDYTHNYIDDDYIDSMMMYEDDEWQEAAAVEMEEMAREAAEADEWFEERSDILRDVDEREFAIGFSRADDDISQSGLEGCSDESSQYLMEAAALLYYKDDLERMQMMQRVEELSDMRDGTSANSAAWIAIANYIAAAERGEIVLPKVVVVEAREADGMEREARGIDLVSMYGSIKAADSIELSKDDPDGDRTAYREIVVRYTAESVSRSLSGLDEKGLEDVKTAFREYCETAHPDFKLDESDTWQHALSHPYLDYCETSIDTVDLRQLAEKLSVVEELRDADRKGYESLSKEQREEMAKAEEKKVLGMLKKSIAPKRDGERGRTLRPTREDLVKVSERLAERSAAQSREQARDCKDVAQEQGREGATQSRDRVFDGSEAFKALLDRNGVDIRKELGGKQTDIDRLKEFFDRVRPDTATEQRLSRVRPAERIGFNVTYYPLMVAGVGLTTLFTMARDTVGNLLEKESMSIAKDDPVIERM